MLRRALGLAALSCVPLFLIGCDNPSTRETLTGPTDRLQVTLGIDPAAVALTPTFGLGCPFQAPFSSAFSLIVHDRGTTRVRLDQVTIRFIDGSNISSPPIPFPSGQLQGMFSSRIVIPPLTSATFAFTPQFGCGIGIAQSLVADLVLLDQFGARHSMSLSAPVR